MVHHLFWSEQNLSLIRKQRLVRIECVRTELLRCCTFRSRSPEVLFLWMKPDLRAKMQGTRWRSQLRHCASSRPEGVNGIFRWHNPSGRTMAMGWTQAATEMRTINSKGGWCLELTNVPPSCADCLEIWEPQPPGTLGACPGLYRDCLAFTFYL